MKKLLFALFLVLSCQAQVLAQGLNLAAEDPNKPTDLALAPDPDLPHGKTATVRGLANVEGQRMLVRGLGVMQPVVVTVFPEQKDARVRVELFKENWQQAERSEVSADSGRVQLRFRTEGDLGIWVKGEDGAPVPFYAVVWVGDEVEAPVPNPFTPTPVADMQSGPSSAPSAAAGGLGTTAWLAIVAGLLVVIGGLLVLVLRGQRRGQTGATVLLLSLLSTSAWADPVEPLQPVSARAAAEAFARNQGLDAANAAAGAAGGVVASTLTSFGGILLNAREFLDSWRTLTGRDADSQPILMPDGMPQVPSACAGNAACASCYGEAQENLKKTRIVLEKLRLIGKRTKEFSDKSIALGDAASTAVPGSASGLAWIQEKRKIQDEMKNFEPVYDRKYRELMGNLRDNLQAIGRCEAQLGVPDWYNRYGFLYFQFMEGHYKRNW
ncbi:hypothetical protein [Hymenobacter koreensis]|uniref:Uncharacterized protein n=1 Tax=Hymenobacter koreensis TaxID=1084523 RepID=A0ABP8IV20_9BACT